MSNLIRDLAPLLAKLLVTLVLAAMVFTGHLNGGLLAGALEAIGHAFTQ